MRGLKMSSNLICLDIGADESGLFWRLLPDKTLSFKSEKVVEEKKLEERITFLLCTNSDGTEKMPLFTIGRFQKPRCLSGLKALPVQYSACSQPKNHHLLPSVERLESIFCGCSAKSRLHKVLLFHEGDSFP